MGEQDRSRQATASRVWRALERHPLLVVAAVAAVVRLVLVIVLGPLRPGVVVPDEQQYLDLARSVASGAGAEAYEPGRGQALYDTTATFMRPLTLLTEVFGSHQLVGQLLAAVFGVLTAVLATALARRVVDGRYAMGAGLVVAMLPSQAYWSSLVLRESMVWAALAAMALAVSSSAAARSPVALAGSGLLAAAALAALADVRALTAVLASFSLVGAALLTRHRRRVLIPVGAVLIAVLVPAQAGIGPLGLAFVADAVPALATIRTNLSIGADSSIVDKQPTPPASSPTEPAGRPVATGPEGDSYLVDDSSGASLSALPRGLVAVTVRPLPWEPSSSLGLTMAKVENAGWLVLYVLAAVGVVAGWDRRGHLAFPALVTATFFVSAAVTQGNLGTAFRHRSQVLFALAVLAAVGLQHLVATRRPRRGLGSRSPAGCQARNEA